MVVVEGDEDSEDGCELLVEMRGKRADFKNSQNNRKKCREKKEQHQARTQHHQINTSQGGRGEISQF